MLQADDKLLKVMRTSFRTEMSERLLALSQYVANLEDLVAEPATQDAEKQAALIVEMLRELHNLKGAARAVGIPEIEELCHVLESLLAVDQQHESELPTFLDLLYEGIEIGDQLFNQLNLGQKTLDTLALAHFIQRLHEFSKPPQNALIASATPVKGGYKGASGLNINNNENSVRVDGKKLDELLAASTELLVARLRMRQHQEVITSLVSEGQSWSRIWCNVRASHGRLVQRSGANGKGVGRDSDLNNLLRFVTANEQRLSQLTANLTRLQSSFNRDLTHLSVVTDQLQFETRRLRLIPLSVVLEELERSIRQLARDLGKQVQLVVHGAELEIDKKLFEHIKAPLLHLLRNAIDHGLESPAQRLYNNKTATGTINISFHQTGNSIDLEVRDDGSGIDIEQVKKVAVTRGLITQDAADNLERLEAMQLIFHSGFSTRQEVNGISGRGIGLDAVKDVATRLGGNVEVDSWPGSGTSFHFSVPNILVTAEGILVKVNDQTFVLPVDGVEHSFLLSNVELQVIGSNHYMVYKGRQIILASLVDLLGLSAKPTSENNYREQYIVILRSRGHLAAFTISNLLKNQEVVVKSFSKPLVRVRHVSGATILADGQVALILNPDDLVVAAALYTGNKSKGLPLAEPVSPGTNLPGKANQKAVTHKQRVLVVDDSVTTRTLEKNILEAAGFYVNTARNGIEAMAQLQTESFDLIIADMEMPEMNGIELIRYIKQDKRFNETPVIIVTSLDTSEDKTRGLEAGADAYIVKSRFDQQSLLTTVRQII